MRLAAVLCVLLSSAAVLADDEPVGRGGACRARSDCAAGLHCAANKCATEVGLDEVNNAENAATRGFFAVAVGAALPTIWNSVGEGAQIELRLGLFTGGFTQIQLELSPGTTVLSNVTNQPMGVFEAGASIAFMPQISDMVYWLLRFGGGGGFLFNAPTYSLGQGALAPFGELRMDLFGTVIRPSRHLFIELDVPSFRVLFVTSAYTNVLLTWITSVTVGYVF
jgi:hypothetical protein